MADLCINPEGIESIDAQLDTKADDLIISITTEESECISYKVGSDERFIIDYIYNKIQNKPANNDLKITEYAERHYLYIDTGDDEPMQVTGRRID